MALTKEMCIAALDKAFDAGIGRLHAQFIDSVMNKDSDATRLFNRGLKRHLEVYEIAREAVEDAFARPAVGPEAPTATQSATQYQDNAAMQGMVGTFKDYVPESAALYAPPGAFKDYVPEGGPGYVAERKTP